MGAAKKPLLFDTLDSVKKLEAAGVPQKQAEAHVRLFSQIVEETICSKQDLLEAEGRLRIEIEQVRKETWLQIEQAINDLIKWFIGTSLVSLGLIYGYSNIHYQISTLQTAFTNV